MSFAGGPARRGRRKRNISAGPGFDCAGRPRRFNAAILNLKVFYCIRSFRRSLSHAHQLSNLPIKSVAELFGRAHGKLRRSDPSRQSLAIFRNFGLTGLSDCGGGRKNAILKPYDFTVQKKPAPKLGERRPRETQRPFELPLPALFRKPVGRRRSVGTLRKSILMPN
jgi:hypothetical protein